MLRCTSNGKTKVLHYGEGLVRNFRIHNSHGIRRSGIKFLTSFFSHFQIGGSRRSTSPNASVLPPTTPLPHSTNTSAYFTPRSAFSTPSSAAIVPPFNYSPPVNSGPSRPTQGQGQGQPAKDHVFVRPRPVSKPILDSDLPSGAAVRRNDSYASSMGRRSIHEVGLPRPESRETSEKGMGEKRTSSVMVTLV